MTVFVFSTGSVLKTANTSATILVSVDNRTTGPQEYRVIVWNTSAGAKTALFDDTDVVGANSTEVKSFTIPNNANVSRYEVEIRAVNPHVVPYLQQSYADLFNSSIFEAVYADELFRDSSDTDTL